MIVPFIQRIPPITFFAAAAVGGVLFPLEALTPILFLLSVAGWVVLFRKKCAFLVLVPAFYCAASFACMINTLPESTAPEAKEAFVSATVTRATPRRVSDLPTLRDDETASTHKIHVEGWDAFAFLKTDCDLIEGDKITFKGTPIPPDAPKNPFETDRREAYRRQQARALFVVNGEDIKITSESKNLIHRIRRAVRSSLYKHLSTENAALVSGLVLGYTESISERRNDLYRKSGTAHILAISGMHISIIHVALSFVCGLLAIPLRTRRFVILIVLSMFFLLTGFSVPAARAYLLSAYVLAGALLYNRTSVMCGIAFSMIVILLVSPFDLFTASFQLSYAAFIGVVIASKLFPENQQFEEDLGLLERFKRRLKRKTIMLLGTSAIVTTVIFPITVWHFNMITPATMFCNLVVIPLFDIYLLIAIALCMFNPFGVLFAGGIADGVLTLLGSAADWVNGVVTAIPYSWNLAAIDNGWVVVVFYAAAAMFLLAAMLPRRPVALFAQFAAFAGLCFMVALISQPTSRAPDAVVFSDGSCLIQCYNDVILVNPSNSRYFKDAVLKRCMAHWGFRRIDRVIYFGKREAPFSLSYAPVHSVESTDHDALDLRTEYYEVAIGRRNIYVFSDPRPSSRRTIKIAGGEEPGVLNFATGAVVVDEVGAHR